MILIRWKKISAINEVLKLLSDGKIQVQDGNGDWCECNIIDTVGEYRIKPATLFGAEIPTPLTKSELMQLGENVSVYSISFWGKDWLSVIHVQSALLNWSDHSIVYQSRSHAEEAINSLRKSS